MGGGQAEKVVRKEAAMKRKETLTVANLCSDQPYFRVLDEDLN